MPRLLPALHGVVLSLFCVATVLADDKAIPAELLRALKDPEADVRVKAIMGLSKLGPEVVPVLVEAIKDDEEEVSQAAAYALQVIKLEPEVRLGALRPFLKRPEAAVRQGIAGALARCGPGAVAPLLDLLKDEAPGVRKQAVLSLQTLVSLQARTEQDPPAAKEALPGLEKALKDEDAPVRLAVVQALPRFGPGAAPLLLAALRDEDGKVRAYAAAALTAPAVKLDAKIALEPLVRQFKVEPEGFVRQSLLKTLGKLGDDAVPALTEALRDKDPAVQKAALTALVPIGPAAKSAFTAIKELASKAEHPDLLKTAIAALPKFGAEGQAALLDLLKRDDSAVRFACLQAVAAQKELPSAVVPGAIGALTDKNEKVRALAAYVLGKLGPEAKEALPALAKAREDSDERVRELAAKAVKQIEGK
jgi:HEAT repeat protein